MKALTKSVLLEQIDSYLCKKAIRIMSIQVKLLTSLAKDIKAKQTDRKSAVITLQSAKILTKSENLTGNFSTLKKVITTKK